MPFFFGLLLVRIKSSIPAVVAEKLSSTYRHNNNSFIISWSRSYLDFNLVTFTWQMDKGDPISIIPFQHRIGLAMSDSIFYSPLYQSPLLIYNHRDCLTLGKPISICLVQLTFSEHFTVAVIDYLVGFLLCILGILHIDVHHTNSNAIGNFLQFYGECVILFDRYQPINLNWLFGSHNVVFLSHLCELRFICVNPIILCFFFLLFCSSNITIGNLLSNWTLLLFFIYLMLCFNKWVDI